MNAQELVRQLALAVPIIMVAAQTLTAAIHGLFNINSDNANHAVSWIVSVLCGVGFVAFNGLYFGFAQQWANYLCGAACGICVGGMANGWYDWPAIKEVFDAITMLFSRLRRRIRKPQKQ